MQMIAIWFGVAIKVDLAMTQSQFSVDELIWCCRSLLSCNFEKPFCGQSFEADNVLVVVCISSRRNWSERRSEQEIGGGGGGAKLELNWKNRNSVWKKLLFIAKITSCKASNGNWACFLTKFVQHNNNDNYFKVAISAKNRFVFVLNCARSIKFVSAAALNYPLSLLSLIPYLLSLSSYPFIR